MKQPFQVFGESGGVSLGVSGVLDGQMQFPPRAGVLLRGSGPPGGPDSVSIIPLPSAERTHQAVRAAADASSYGPIPADARQGYLVIQSRRWPAWVAAEPLFEVRAMGRVWVGIWPEQEDSTGVLLVRAREIRPGDNPLRYFQACPVVQSIVVEREGG